MSLDRGRNDWERRYDESLARERVARANDDDMAGGEYAVLEASGCLPGWFGVIAGATTGLVVFLRRRRHRR